MAHMRRITCALLSLSLVFSNMLVAFAAEPTIGESASETSTVTETTEAPPVTKPKIPLQAHNPSNPGARSAAFSFYTDYPSSSGSKGAVAVFSEDFTVRGVKYSTSGSDYNTATDWSGYTKVDSYSFNGSTYPAVKINNPQEGNYLILVDPADGVPTDGYLALLSYTSADTEPPEIILTQMSFSSGTGSKKLTAVIGAKDTSGLQSLQYGTAPLVNPQAFSVPYTTISTGTTINVDYLSNGMVLWIKAIDKAGNMEETAVLVVNPTTEGEKIITPLVASKKDGMGKVTSVDVSFTYDPTSYSNDTGTTISFVPATSTGLDKEIVVDNISKTFPITANGDYTFLLDFPMTKTITVGGRPQSLTTTVHYRLKVPVTAIGSTEAPATPPVISSSVTPGGPGLQPSVTVSTSTADAKVFYKWVTSDQAGNVGTAGFTASGSNSVTVTAPNPATKAQLLVAYAEKNGLKSNITVQLVVDEDRMLEIGATPPATTWVADTRELTIKTAASGTYVNSYVAGSKLSYASAPDYTASEGGTLNTETNPTFEVSANRKYSFGVSHIARVDVVNPFDTTKIVEAATSYRVSKDFTEDHIDLDQPTIPNYPAIIPDPTGTTMDLTGIADSGSGIKTVGSFWDKDSEFVAPTGDWDAVKYPITVGAPTVGRFDRGQLIIYAEDNVGRFNYQIVAVNGVGLPDVSYTKTPNSWTSQDVTVEVSIKPATGDTIDNWVSNLGTIAKQPDNSGKLTVIFNDNEEKELTLVGPSGTTLTEKITVTNIDKIKPTVDSLTQTPDTATTGNVTVNVAFSDNAGGSGVKTVDVSTGATVVSKDISTGRLVLEVDTNATGLSVTVTDNAGNVTVKTFNVTTIDKALPVISVTPSETEWTNQNITIDVELIDSTAIGTVDINSGLIGYVFGNVAVVSNPMETIPVPAKTSDTATYRVSGNTKLEFEGTDAAGNAVTQGYTVDNIDKDKPVVDITQSSRNSTGVTLNLTFTDDISGIKTQEYALVADTSPATLQGAAWKPALSQITASYASGSKYVVARATDNASNASDIEIFSLFDFEQYVKVATTPTEWVTDKVSSAITVNWIKFMADSGIGDVSSVTFTTATGKNFGSIANTGDANTAIYALDHNDTWTVKIVGIPDGTGGTFDWTVKLDVKNIDTVAPVLSSTRAGHYDQDSTYVVVTAQDVASVAGLAFSDISQIDQAVVMPSSSVPAGNTFKGTLSGTPVVLNANHMGNVSFSATDTAAYSLVVVDKAGNLSSIPLNTSRLTAGPIVNKEDIGWTKGDVDISVDASNPEATVFDSAISIDGEVITTLPKVFKATKNGKYDISALYGYKQLDTKVVYPNNTTGHSQLDVDRTAVVLPTLADANPFIASHNIGKYDWKLPSSIVVSNIDKTAPRIVVSDNSTGGVGANEVTVTIKANDPVTNQEIPDASGIDYISYTVGTNTPVVVRTPQTSFVLKTSDEVSISVGDNAGNVSTETYRASVDSMPPVLTYTTNPIAGTYTATRTVINMDITDDVSGIKTVTVPSDLKLMQAPSNADPLHHTYVYYTEKNGTYNVVVTDMVGNTSTYPVIINNIDKYPPTVTPTLSPAGVTYGSVVITLDVFDAESGIKQVQMHDGSIQQPVDGKLTYTAPSNGTYTFVAQDNAGNITTTPVSVSNIRVEISRPQDSKYETVDQSNNTGTRIVTEWSSSKQTISPQAYPTDQIDKYVYAVTKLSREDETPRNPDWKTSRTKPSIKLDREGIFSVQIKAYNKAGTESAVTEYVILQDTTKPRISSEKITNSYVSFKAKDNLSGIDYIQCDCGNDGDSDGYIKCVKSDGKTHKYTIADLAGNKATETLKIGDTSKRDDNSNDDDDEDDRSSSSASAPSTSTPGKVVGNTNNNTSAPQTSGKPGGAKNPPTGSK